MPRGIKILFIIVRYDKESVMILGQLIFYFAIDALIFILLMRKVMASRDISIQAAHQMKWVMPVILAAMIVYILKHYNGMFWKIECVCMAVYAVQFYFIRSGVSPRGFVAGGRLYPYARIRNVKADWDRLCLLFEYGGRLPETILFSEDDMDKAIAYLKKVQRIQVRY